MFIVGINPPFPVMDGLWHCYTHAVESVRGLAQIFCYIPQRMPNSSGCVLMIPANFTVGLARIWLVVSIPLKNISQLGWLFPIYGKKSHVPKHQPVFDFPKGPNLGFMKKTNKLIENLWWTLSTTLFWLICGSSRYPRIKRIWFNISTPGEISTIIKKIATNKTYYNDSW